MDEYVKCKYCKHCNSSERKGCKWYCEWYGMYVDPDEVSECKHYRD